MTIAKFEIKKKRLVASLERRKKCGGLEVCLLLVWNFVGQFKFTQSPWKFQIVYFHHSQVRIRKD